MPFLRAALLKKKADTEPEAIKTPEPVMEAEAEPVVGVIAPVVIEEVEEEPEDFTNFDALHNVIDEKIEQESEEFSSEPAIIEEEPEFPQVLEISEAPEEIMEPDSINEAVTEETITEEISPEPVVTEEEPKLSEEPEIMEKPEEPISEPETPVSGEGEEIKPEEPFKPKYDVTSGKRYVDEVSTKTPFDKMLDELAAISKELLSWQVEKFARDYTVKFPGEGDKSEADAKKYEAFLGGYITNAAMILYDNGYMDAAIKQLDMAQKTIAARKRLEEETVAIKERVEEEDAVVDLSDILGMFGDG